MAESPGQRRWPVRTFVIAVLGVLAVGLAATTGFLAYKLSGLRAEKAARAQALESARQAVTNLVSFDYRRLPAQFRVLSAQTTGVFHSQLAKYEAQVRTDFTQRKLVSHGVIDDAVIASVKGAKASILVAVDDTIAPLGTSAAKATPQRYRMIVTMSRSKGTWLLYNVTVAA